MEMISVIVPCYNCHSTLEKCVTSITDQTFPDVEIILVNDGSTDNTGKICDILSKKYHNIVALHQENTGPMGACKKGIRIAKGNYIAFVDSDDWMLSDTLSQMYEKAKKYDAGMVVCGYTVEYSDGRIVQKDVGACEGFYNKERIQKEILPRLFHHEGMESKAIPFSRWAKLFKKQLLQMGFEYFDERIFFGDDDVMVFTSALLCDSMYCFQGYFPYHYWRNDGSLTGRYDSETYAKYRMLRDTLLDIAKKNQYEYCEQIEIHFLENALLALKKEMHRNKKETIDKVRKNIQSIVEEADMQYALRVTATKIKGYGIKERIFISLLQKKKFLLCILLTRILSLMKIGAR